MKETGIQPLLELLKTYLQDKHLLLLLDNFEQVVTAAPLVAELLDACPEVKVLVTSREVLHLRAERQFSVLPLSLPDLKHLPDAETLPKYTAVALFVQRAQAVKPDFQLTKGNARVIAEICVRLDGLPLAIELAAARIKLFPPQALLKRLEHRMQVLTGGAQDVPTRQQTLRNTIQWSYDLLSTQEQRLFRRLAVFVGGCTLEAVGAVSSAVSDGVADVLDRVTSLIDKNLVQQTEQEGEEPWLLMLETIREYGQEGLSVNGEAESICQMHAAYYLALVEKAELNWGGLQEALWFARLEQEHANLQAAMSWLLERGETEMALRAGAALWWFWLASSYVHEGWNFLERALERSEEVATSVRAKALWAAGNLAGYLGHFEQGEALCQESLALFREMGDTQGMGTAIFHLAMVAQLRADFRAAHSLYEESLVLTREADDKNLFAWVLRFLGHVVKEQGDYDRARPLLEESLALFRELGNKAGAAGSLFSLAVIMFYQGDLARARALAEESLALFSVLGRPNIDEAAPVLLLLGTVTLYQGDTTTARMLFEKSLAFWRETGVEPQIAWTLSLVAKVSAAQGDYAAARALYEESLVRGQEMNSNLAIEDIAPMLEGLAAVSTAQGEVTWAARLCGAAEALRETLGTPLPPVYRTDYERSVAAARKHLGEKAFTAAWAQGRAMTPEQALAARELATPTPAPAGQPSPPPMMARATYPDGLTTREVEVLRLVAQGLSDVQVAEQLVISPRTVHAHLSSIYSKLDITSRSAATRYAVDRKLT